MPEENAALWIKDPLSILADGAERGIVVQSGAHRRTGSGGPQSDNAEADNIRCRRARRAARAHQHASSLLPDTHARRSGGARSRIISLAAGALSDLGAIDAGSARSRRDGGDGRVAVVRLHPDHRSSLRFSRRSRRRHRHRSCGGQASRHARAAHARFDEPVAARRRTAARQRRAGRGYHPRRLRTRGEALSSGRRRRDGADCAGALLAVFGDDLADARDRGFGADGSMCACTPTSPKPKTRTASASSSTNAARSIIWKIVAGSTSGPGSPTAFISTTARSSGLPARARLSRIARTAIRRWLLAACPVCAMEEAGMHIGLGRGRLGLKRCL